jgi:nucleoside phosphorylase
MSVPTRLLVALTLIANLAACGETSTAQAPPGRVLLFAAFPAELAPLLERASIEETVQIGERWFRVGTLGGTPVVIGMTGIGIANAAAASRMAFDAFDVIGAVFSGVAGSYLRIGDVAVPETWALADGAQFASDPEWLALAGEVTTPGVVELEDCTLLPNDPTHDPVCLTVPPVIVVGGHGVSSGFEDFLIPCQPNSGDVFGCDGPHVDGVGRSADTDGWSASSSGGSAGEPPAAQDMESAAVAREATARGRRFIAFRAVSDGAGDPLDLPGFPAQFFAYYRLAAENAASTTTAFLERLAAAYR